MSTKLGRMLRDFRAFRKARTLERELYPAPPEPKLNVFETFLHLKPWQRVAMILSCILCYTLSVQGTFSANVLPHLQAIIGPDGRFNSGEAVAALYLSSSVIFLSASPVLMLRATWFERLGLVFLCLFIGWTNINYACATQKAAREARNDGPRQKVERIHRLDETIAQLERAFQQVPTHAYVADGQIKAAEKAAEELRKSAEAECSTGIFRSKRGPKCDGLEKRRDAKLEELAKLQADKDLTDRASNIEAELWKTKEARKAEGAAPERDGTEMEPFPAFLAGLHFMSKDTAQALSDNRPITDAITMELEAWFGASLSFKFIFWIFGLFTCSKTEADRRVKDLTMQIAAAHAAKAAELLPDEQPATKSVEAKPAHDPFGWGEPEPKSEVNHAEVLGIEEPDPAFVAAPQNVEEAVAAEFIKAAKPKRDTKARTTVEGGPSSTIQWHKECAFEQRGMTTSRRKAYNESYVPWCETRNLIPQKTRAFGDTLKAHCNVVVDSSGKNGPKYVNLGLRPAHLRVVA